MIADAAVKFVKPCHSRKSWNPMETTSKLWLSE